MPFTWSLIRFGDIGQNNYAAWRSFTAYLAYNFRGVDTTSAGRTDDLLWRWAHHPDHDLTSLAQRLEDGECGECAARTYFAGLSGKDRLQVLIHDWRVASYVNNVSLGEKQYAFAPQFGFVPSRDIGYWQNADHIAANDSINIPPEVTLSSAERTRELTFVGRTPASQVSLPHVMALDVFGSEYWVVHSDPSLGTGTNDLVVRVAPEGVARHDFGNFYDCVNTGGRLMVSVVGYAGPADSLAIPNNLWKHPEYATLALPPRWVDVDSLAGAVELTLPGFGTTYKAALVVISLGDGQYGEYTNLLYTNAERVLSYRLNLALRTAPYQTPNPRLVARTSGAQDDYPAWSPLGDEIALHTTRGQYSQIYRCRLSDTTLTPLVSQPYHQAAPDWSPRGDWIAFTQDSSTTRSDIWAFNIATQQLKRLTSLPGFALREVFQPNGQRLAYVRFPGNGTNAEIRRINLDGGNDVLLCVTPGSGFVTSTPRWTPDGNWVYFAIADSLYAVSAEGGAPILRISLIPSATSFDFTAGSARLAVEQPWQAPACGGPSLTFRRIAVKDTSTGDSQARFYQRGARLYRPRWSFDGTRIAYSSDQNDPSNTDLFVGQVSFDHAPIFSPPLRDTILALPCQPYTFAFDLNASDPDGEAVTYQAAYLPPGSSLNANHFTWPNPGPPGADYYVVFRALDGSGGLDNKVVKLSLAADPARPAAASDLTIGTGRTSLTITWTAPGDDSLAGTACRYDLRFSTAPITETNFNSITDTIATQIPGPAGTVECYGLDSRAPCTWYYFGLKTRDDAGHWSALRTASGKTKCSGTQEVSCGGDGFFAQGGGGGGWSAENALFDPAPAGQSAADGVLLRSAPQATDGSYALRLLKNGPGTVTLDEVSLATLDHAASASAFQSGDRIVLGTVSPVFRVTDAAGSDITGAFGDSALHPFVGAPGQSLLVQLNEGGTGGDALLLETAAGGPMGSPDSSGMLIQVPQGKEWGTVAQHFPRRRFDRFLADSLGSATVRLVFLGEHALRFIGSVAIAGAATPQQLNLLEAKHSRLGNVSAAVAVVGGATAMLSAGDALTLNFAAPAPTQGQARDWVLLVHGAKGNLKSVLVARATPLPDAPPARFALYQNQPNPFAGSTTFRFDLPKPEAVRLDVFDLSGRRITTVRDGWMPAGRHSVAWDSRDANGAAVMPGVYLYRITAGAFRTQKKLVVLP